MAEMIRLGDVAIEVTRKAVKNMYLSVRPPAGRVTLVVPKGTSAQVFRAFAASKLGWIRKQQAKQKKQAWEDPHQFVNGESHYVWGRRYVLSVIERDERPRVTFDHQHITLNVRPGSDGAKRAAVMQGWHRQLLHEVVPPLIATWEPKLGVKVSAYYVQRMKTRWGSCNYKAGNIRLNTELVKEPTHLLEYVVVHELAHLIEPTHNHRFKAILDQHYPSWRAARDELNQLPRRPG